MRLLLALMLISGIAIGGESIDSAQQQSGEKTDKIAKIITHLFPTPEDRYIAAKNITAIRNQGRNYASFDTNTARVEYERKNRDEIISIYHLHSGDNLGMMGSTPKFNPIDQLIEMGLSEGLSASALTQKNDIKILNVSVDPKILQDVWLRTKSKVQLPISQTANKFELIPNLPLSENIPGYNFLISYVDYVPVNALEVQDDCTFSIVALCDTLEKMELLEQGTMIRVRAFIPMPADESEFPKKLVLNQIRLGKAHAEYNPLSMAGRVHFTPAWWEWADGE